MSLADSKQGKNRSGVRMFKDGKEGKNRNGKWTARETIRKRCSHAKLDNPLERAMELLGGMVGGACEGAWSYLWGYGVGGE